MGDESIKEDQCHENKKGLSKLDTNYSINECQFLAFEGSTNVPYNKNLLTFVTIGIIHPLQYTYFNIKIMRHTCNNLVKLTITNSLLI